MSLLSPAFWSNISVLQGFYCMGPNMQDNKERWFQLAERAANEQDSEKLHALIKEINDLLAEKQKRLDDLRRLERNLRLSVSGVAD